MPRRRSRTVTVAEEAREHQAEESIPVWILQPRGHAELWLLYKSGFEIGQASDRALRGEWAEVADKEIRYIVIDMKEGFGPDLLWQGEHQEFHVFDRDLSGDHLSQFEDQCGSNIYQEGSDYIATNRRFMMNMKHHVTACEPVAFGVGYKKDSSGIRFYSQSSKTSCGKVMDKSTVDLLRIFGCHTPTVPVLLQHIPFSTASTRPQL